MQNNFSCVEAALLYAKKGWLVFPLQTPDWSGECSCNKQNCSSIGKHPRTQNGFKDATTNLEQIREWWNKWPDANIGICTGKESNLIVIDIDPRNGGNSSFAELEKKYGELPATLEVETGGDGKHLFFEYPNTKIKSGTHILGDGVDIKGEGGYVVASPSLHKSGKSYNWKNYDCPLASLPEWLKLILTKPENKEAPSHHADENSIIPEGRRNNTLISLAGTMRKNGMPPEAILAALLETNTLQCDPPLIQREVEKIVESISRYEMGELPIENKSTKKNSSPKVEYTASFDGLVDLVEKDGKVIFLTLEGLKEDITIDECKYFPPPKDQFLWIFPRAEKCLRYAKEDNDADLYEALVETAKSVSILPNEHHYHLLAAWIMHTYHLDHENYSPMLAFDAVPDRGKSRTGKFLTYVSYRGIRVSEMREANLIRYSKDVKATLFFDLKDAHGSAKRGNCEDLMLNRFEKGAKVSRVIAPDKGSFKDIIHFDVFGPTIIATNESLGYILESRGITIVMPEVGEGDLRRFNQDITPDFFLSLKERLVAFRMRHLKNPLPQVDKPVPKRLGDIMRPLLRIVKGVKPEFEYHLIQLIQESADERKLTKAQAKEGQILNCFITFAEEKNIRENDAISVGEIKNLVNNDRPSIRDQISSHKIGSFLTEVGFKRTRGDNNTAAYAWDSILAEKLKISWGLNTPPSISLTPQLNQISNKKAEENQCENEEYFWL